MKERHAAAEEWMQRKWAWVRKNPFGELAPDEQLSMADKAIEESEDDAATAGHQCHRRVGRQRTGGRQTGATRRPGSRNRMQMPQRIPQVRGDRLEAEIEQRLSGPYQSARDRDIVNTIREHELEGVDADDIMQKLAHAPAHQSRPAACLAPAR